MIDINLLPVKNVLTQKEKNLRANLTRAFILISGGLLIISLIILGAKFFVRLQLDNQTTKRDQLLVEFKKQGQMAQDVRTLKNKIAGIKIIKGSRTNFATIAGALRDTTQGTTLKEASIDSDRNITVTASVDSLEALGSFINKMTVPDNNPFAKTVMRGLTRNSGRSYGFGMNTQYIN